MVVAVCSAFFIYEKYVKTVPKAAGHLPDGAAFALRLDVEQVVTYEPFRKHILKVFERSREGREPRAKHLERKTTVELGIDSRELALAVMPDEQWVILLGGVFRRDEVLEGAQEMLDEEGIATALEENLLCHASGICFGVAEDGTFVLASTKNLALQARAPGRLDGYRADLQESGTLAGIVVQPESTKSDWVNGLTGARATSGRLALKGGRPFVVEGRGLTARTDSPRNGEAVEIARVIGLVSGSTGEEVQTATLTRVEFNSFVGAIAQLLETSIARKSGK